MFKMVVGVMDFQAEAKKMRVVAVELAVVAVQRGTAARFLC